MRLLLVLCTSCVFAVVACARAPRSAASAAPSAGVPTATQRAAAPPRARLFSPPVDGARDLLVVYTASVQGYVEPCGCTAEPLGGLSRLGAVLEDARAAFGARVLFVDAGDLLFEKPDDHAEPDRCQAEVRTELLVGTYARFGLAATTAGPLDLVRGASFRDALLRRHGVPSIDDGAGMIVERGGIRTLLIGATDATDPARVQATVDAHRADPVDLVVVLAQATHPRAKALAAQWRGVDLVVVGRAGEGPAPPERVNDAVVVSAGWQAQHAGIVVAHLAGREPGAPLALDDRVANAAARRQLLDVRIAEIDKLLPTLPEGPRKQFQQTRRDAFAAERAALADGDVPPLSGPHLVVQALPLRRGMPEEAAAARDLAAYLRAIPALVARCERDVVCPEPDATTAAYVGAETCRGCHPAAYAHWQQALVPLTTTQPDGSRRTHEVGHSRAWTTLVEIGRDRDRGCVGCHSAGFNQPGGACTTTSLVERRLTGVQCESCHGPGSLHAATTDPTKIRREVDEAVCRGCHVPPHIERPESFVFTERLKLILGDGHGAARRATLTTTPEGTP